MSPETPHISLDLWDTVLRRRCHPDEVKLYTAQRMLHLLRPYLQGYSFPGAMELLRRRQRIEAEIGTRRKREGFDDEYEIEEVLALCILDLTEKSVVEKELMDLAGILVQGEINQEIAVTYLDEDLINYLSSCRYERLHIVSDFYMSADKIRTILQAHSFPFPVENLFISCDSKLNKRSGRLFQYVCETLGLEPGSLMHIGDNLFVDVEMAEKSGLQAYHFVGTEGQAAREQNHEFFAQRSVVGTHPEALLLSRKNEASYVFADKGEEAEMLRLYGRFMSPFFVGFGLNIQELCIAGGHETAHFFTREGIFFQRVFDRVQAHELFDMHPVESRLLPVSRLASFFPSLQDISPGEMMRLWSQYHTQSVNSFLGSLGVDPERYLPVIRKNGLDPEEMISSPWLDKKFLRLLDDENFLGPLKEEHQARRENLKDFYHDCGFGSDGKAFVIDIGWRGTIQDNLALIFKDVTIEGCYLGLQEFFNSQPENTIKHGYIADANRGEHHVMLKHVMPFEMLCFGTGGSAIGYRRNSSGKMAVEFQVDPVEDQIHNERIHFFQEGVLEGVDQVCRTVARHGISTQELRAEARVLAAHFLTSPPMVMCRAFNALKQDDTFGMAQTIFPGENTFRLSDRLLTYFSAARRQRFLSDLEKSSWPQCLLRSRYFGIFHRLGSMKKVTQDATRSVGDKVAILRRSRKWSIDTYPVRVVIAGMEHSGTTLLSMLLKQDPRLQGGFECGFLLAASPRDFKNVHPWYEWMQEPVKEHHWGVSAKHMERICSSGSWGEAYQKLMEYSPVFDQGQTQQICDKTPRYLMYLDDVLDKVPDFVPCIVIEKNIENLWRSHKKRYGHLGNFCKNFERYGNGLRRALLKHGERIHRVQYENLCSDLAGQLREIFSIIDLPFRAEYVTSRQSNIQQYYQRKKSREDKFSTEEMLQLGRLRSKFSDLLIA